jgi:hypothetical protein
MKKNKGRPKSEITRDVRITLRLYKEMLPELEKLAQKQFCSLAQVVLQIIAERINFKLPIK